MSVFKDSTYLFFGVQCSSFSVDPIAVKYIYYYVLLLLCLLLSFLLLFFSIRYIIMILHDYKGWGHFILNWLAFADVLLIKSISIIFNIIIVIIIFLQFCNAVFYCAMLVDPNCIVTGNVSQFECIN